MKKKWNKDFAPWSLCEEILCPTREDLEANDYWARILKQCILLLSVLITMANYITTLTCLWLVINFPTLVELQIRTGHQDLQWITDNLFSWSLGSFCLQGLFFITISFKIEMLMKMNVHTQSNLEVWYYSLNNNSFEDNIFV